MFSRISVHTSPVERCESGRDCRLWDGVGTYQQKFIKTPFYQSECFSTQF